VHGLLYLTVLLMPLSGIIMSLAGGHTVPFWGIGNITLPFIPLDKSLSAFMKFSHTYLAWTIGGLVVIHTAATLKHHFYDRDDVLKRMM